VFSRRRADVDNLHYAIFSAAKIDYDNTQADYKRLSRATTQVAEHVGPDVHHFSLAKLVRDPD
jgi:hypothetical protein